MAVSDKRIDDGGPAFLGDYTRKHPTLKEHGLPADERVSSPGLSLRDYFAAAALTGMLAADSALSGPRWSAVGTSDDYQRGGGKWLDPSGVSRQAFEIADAMLKARSQP